MKDDPSAKRCYDIVKKWQKRQKEHARTWSHDKEMSMQFYRESQMLGWVAMDIYRNLLCESAERYRNARKEKNRARRTATQGEDNLLRRPQLD